MHKHVNPNLDALRQCLAQTPQLEQWRRKKALCLKEKIRWRGIIFLQRTWRDPEDYYWGKIYAA